MAKAQKKAIESKDESQKSNPLFFRKPVPMDSQTHKHAGIKRSSGYAYARQANAVPLTIFEFMEVARSYPIVFTAEANPMPIAVMGVRNANRFVQKDSNWEEGHYIPTYVRKYPFALLALDKETGQEQQYALCVDEESPHYQAEDADTSFYVDGKPSLLSQQAIELCTQFQRQYEVTREFSQLLKDQNLLESKDFTIKLPAGESIKLTGFMVVNEERLHALSDKELAVWRDKRWLGLLYMAISSSANWKYLADKEVK